jgi:hypothetical protein
VEHVQAGEPRADHDRVELAPTPVSHWPLSRLQSCRKAELAQAL